MSAELPPNLEGEPGTVVIDEGYSILSEASFIDISIYDEEGGLVFYTDFERGISPEEISEELKDFASDLLVDPMPNMSWEENVKLAGILKQEAGRIPGLRKANR